VDNDRSYREHNVRPADILAVRFCQTQRNHRNDLGHDDHNDIGIIPDYSKAFHGADHFTMAKRAGDGQIKEVGLDEPRKYLAFLGTLFLFIGTCSVCIVIPGFTPPTGSLSTTAALALCVFIAVPLFGIREQGIAGYLKTYIKPTPIMLPFNIISELSRTLALAIRLFGNMMSGVMIVGILLTITPFIFPIVMTVLGLLTGSVQAYIFSILAAVYIAAATRVIKPKAAVEAHPEPRPA